MPDPLVRRTPIAHKEIGKYGTTPGCEACEAKMRGEVSRRGHTERCRSRIEEAMRADTQDKRKLEKADERMTHKIAKEIEKSDRKRKVGGAQEEENEMDTVDKDPVDEVDGDRQKRYRVDESASSGGTYGQAAGGDSEQHPVRHKEPRTEEDDDNLPGQKKTT